jgi:putative MATE family efflux protein
MTVSLSDHFSYQKLLRFVAPSILMMIVTSIYSIVDGFFVSNFVGKNPFAALNLIFPVIMALAAFGFMIGTGGSALIAKTLGEGKKDEANGIFSMLVVVLAVGGAILSGTCILLLRPISYAVGATELTIDDCMLYGRVLLISLPFFMLQNSFQSFLATAEKPHFGLRVTVFAGLTNMALDFLLVYVFPFGLLGAALATAFSQIVGALIPLVYFLRPNDSPLRLTRPRFDFRALGKACYNGSSEMVSNLSTSLVGVLYNIQLMAIAQENGVSAYGVIMYVSFIFMAFFFGYSIAVTPVVGYHYGAENHAELKSLLKKSLTITLISSLVMTVSSIALASPIARIFVGYDAELCEMTVNALRLYALSFLVCGFNIFGSAFFTGLNNGTASALISFLRTLVLQVAAVLLLPRVLGIDGIWLAITAAEALTLLVTAALFLAGRRKHHYV